MFDGIMDLASSAMDWILDNLPLSPFYQLELYLESHTGGAPDWLKAINWVIPMNIILGTLEAWVIAIAGWYVVKFVIDKISGMLGGVGGGG